MNYLLIRNMNCLCIIVNFVVPIISSGEQGLHIGTIATLGRGEYPIRANDSARAADALEVNEPLVREFIGLLSGQDSVTLSIIESQITAESKQNIR